MIPIWLAVIAVAAIGTWCYKMGMYRYKDTAESRLKEIKINGDLIEWLFERLDDYPKIVDDLEKQLELEKWWSNYIRNIEQKTECGDEKA